MRDDTRLYRLGWIMLIIVGLLMAALSICYEAQRREMNSVHRKLQTVNKEISDAEHKFEDSVNKSVRNLVKTMNPKAENVSFKKTVNVEDIPMIEQ